MVLPGRAPRGPPAFAAVPPARTAEKANPVKYEGPEVANQQKVAYPDIAPAKSTAPPADAFRCANEAARSMPGWTIVDSNAEKGIIEASQASLWFRFTDDIVIRVLPDGSGSRTDVRSVSRVGRSDLGVNARRIRAYLKAFQAQP